MSVTITGIDRVMSNLGKLSNNNIVQNALVDTGDQILRLSESKVPVAEGILKSSGTVVKDNKDVLVGYNQEYAAYQHQGVRKDGTRIITNRPGGGESFFLSSTVEQNKAPLVDFAKEQIQKQIQKLF
jgi:phage gpG-like protein